MTEKEFEKLKVGDKVWLITDFYSAIDEGKKAVQKEVVGKDEDNYVRCVGCGVLSDHCYLTKAEAWEAEVKEYEEAVKADEECLAKKRQSLVRYKAELSKAKEEEEEVCWITDSGEVRKVRKSDYPCYIHYDTEREAYEALMKYYLEKYYETRRKVEETK